MINKYAFILCDIIVELQSMPLYYVTLL